LTGFSKLHKELADEKIGVVLSGCGVYDGTEIHEAVITLLAIARSGAQAVCLRRIKRKRM
jgi:enhancing lycopene biosynthesis protein 2